MQSRVSPIGARGSGRTHRALMGAIAAARDGKRVAFVVSSMSSIAYASSLLAQHAGVSEIDRAHLALGYEITFFSGGSFQFTVMNGDPDKVNVFDHEITDHALKMGLRAEYRGEPEFP